MAIKVEFEEEIHYSPHYDELFISIPKEEGSELSVFDKVKVTVERKKTPEEKLEETKKYLENELVDINHTKHILDRLSSIDVYYLAANDNLTLMECRIEAILEMLEEEK